MTAVFFIIRFDVAPIVISIFELPLDQEIRAVRVIRILLGFERGLVVVAIAEDRNGYIVGVKVHDSAQLHSQFKKAYRDPGPSPIHAPTARLSQFRTQRPTPRTGEVPIQSHHAAGGIRSRISSSGRYSVEIRGVFGKRLRNREQPGTRPQDGCARSSRERVIKIGKFGNRRFAIASRQSLKRFVKT